MNLFFPFFISFVALFGVSRPAFAENFSLNRDRPLSFPSIASKSDLVRMGRWLEGTGMSHAHDSFVYDLFHLGMGVSYPVSPSSNITVSGGQTFLLGMSFK